jgi:hypothetical protein
MAQQQITGAWISRRDRFSQFENNSTASTPTGEA